MIKNVHVPTFIAAAVVVVILLGLYHVAHRH